MPISKKALAARSEHVVHSSNASSEIGGALLHVAISHLSKFAVNFAVNKGATDARNQEKEVKLKSQERRQPTSAALKRKAKKAVKKGARGGILKKAKKAIKDVVYGAAAGAAEGAVKGAAEAGSKATGIGASVENEQKGTGGKTQTAKPK